MYPPEYYSMPATAVPYQGDPAADLLRAVTHQVEYYFSFENLLKDTYMRKHMDSQGFVLVSFIAEFKRLKAMTHDLELIKYVSQQSNDVEHWIGPDGVDRLRAAKTWDKWVLPKEDRDPSARHDGPESLHTPPRPQPKLPNDPHLMRHSSLPVPQSAGPVLGSQGFQSLNSFAAPYNFVPQTTPSTETPSTNHYQTSPTSLSSGQNITQSSATSVGPSPAQVPSYTNGVEETEPDTFTDAEVDTLKVVLRDVPGVDGSSRAASSRTFSNGSVEGVNGLAVTAQSPPPEPVAEWVLNDPRRLR
jgi:la-related protein 1